MPRREPEPVRITSASRSRSDDIWSREKRYMLTMGIRTACFLAGVATFLSGTPRWISWVFFIGSLVLPYVAVVMANAGVSPDPGGPDAYDAHLDRPAIEDGRDRRSDDA